MLIFISLSPFEVWDRYVCASDFEQRVKRKYHFNRFNFFVLAQVTRVFFSRVETLLRFWKREYVGTFVRNHIYFRPVAHKDRSCLKFPH